MFGEWEIACQLTLNTVIAGAVTGEEVGRVVGNRDHGRHQHGQEEEDKGSCHLEALGTLALGSTVFKHVGSGHNETDSLIRPSDDNRSAARPVL